MYAALLTLVLLPGNDVLEPIPNQSAVMEDTYMEGDYGGCHGCGGHGRGGHGGGIEGGVRSRCAPMPQTCYDPRYGCYPGNQRTHHRYPAFHGTYYRRPYNYRHLFEYPWHVKQHEPTSLFSYNVVPEREYGGQPTEVVPLQPELAPTSLPRSGELAPHGSYRR